MCIKLRHTGKIIIPGSLASIKTDQTIKTMRWGVDLGHGLTANARLDSFLKGNWKKWGMIYVGYLAADCFFEKDHQFTFLTEMSIGVIHNYSNFLVVTEDAVGAVKKKHHRQPCYLNIDLLKQAA